MITKIKPTTLFILVFCMTFFLLLVGCAQCNFVKPEISQEQAARDNLYCKQYGMQVSMAMGGNVFKEVLAERECLRTLGYQQMEVK